MNRKNIFIFLLFLSTHIKECTCALKTNHSKPIPIPPQKQMQHCIAVYKLTTEEELFKRKKPLVSSQKQVALKNNQYSSPILTYKQEQEKLAEYNFKIE